MLAIIFVFLYQHFTTYKWGFPCGWYASRELITWQFVWSWHWQRDREGDSFNCLLTCLFTT